jgi:hypothetical protein
VLVPTLRDHQRRGEKGRQNDAAYPHRQLELDVRRRRRRRRGERIHLVSLRAAYAREHPTRVEIHIIPAADTEFAGAPMRLSADIRTVTAMSTYSAQLRKLPGLEHLNRPTAARLARDAERLDVPAGQEIFGTNERWAGAYVVLHGEAVVEAPGWDVLVGPGARLCRSHATGVIRVIARTDVQLLAIGRQAHDTIAVVHRPFTRRDARSAG